MTEAAGSHAADALRWLDAHRWHALALSLPLVVVVHLIAAAVTIRHSNQDPVASDQGAEMWLAATARDDLVPQRTDGVRHPLWSWIARFTYTESQQEFFERGKWLNTLLCIAFLCGLGIVVARWLDPLATANLLLLSSLGILLVRGTYFQPEPCYYILFFLAAVLAWRSLRGGAAVWLHAVFGVVCGLAYLSKPSMAPFLAVFCLAFALRALLTLRAPNSDWSIGRNLVGLAVALGILAVMLVPLAIFSATHFGKPLFNYTKYWMWMDDFMTEAWPFQDRYPGRVQLEQLPPEEAPSPSWYFRRHGIVDAANRLNAGTREVIVRFFFPETKVPLRSIFWRLAGKKWEQPLAHRGVYLLTLGGLCALLIAGSRSHLIENLKQAGNVSCLVFAATLATVYALLYGWYWPIGRGDRFMGSLWIPSVFALVWTGFVLRQRAASGLGDIAYLLTHSIILLSLLAQVAGMLWRFSAGIFLVTRN
jgi:hypothetical protein